MDNSIGKRVDTKTGFPHYYMLVEGKWLHVSHTPRGERAHINTISYDPRYAFGENLDEFEPITLDEFMAELEEAVDTIKARPLLEKVLFGKKEETLYKGMEKIHNDLQDLMLVVTGGPDAAMVHEDVEQILENVEELREMFFTSVRPDATMGIIRNETSGTHPL